jgi:hypothetical protein
MSYEENNSEPFIKNNYSIDSAKISTTKTTGLMLGMLAIGGLLTTRALTVTTAAFADSNAISIVEGLYAALLGQPVQMAVPPHRYKDRTD